MTVRSDRWGRHPGHAMAPRERAGNPSDELTFYAGLEPFTEFTEVADPARYVAAPDDWIVVLADIKGSTEAARAGRYKDVNLVGAACITAVLNVTRDLYLPYAFGGDGATMLIPPSGRDVVADALRRIRRLAGNGFGLELRVGLVAVRELRRLGRTVLVAKYQLSPGNNLAMFAGGGLELAERLIKSDPAFTLEEQGDPAPPDLHGLSCRWEPYRSLRGHMLTLLVRPLEADALALQRQILRDLAAIVGETPGSASPIRAENMRFAWPPRGLRAEAIARARWRALPSLLARHLGAILAAGAGPALRSQDRRVRCARLPRGAAAQLRPPEVHRHAAHGARLHRGRERCDRERISPICTLTGGSRTARTGPIGQ